MALIRDGAEVESQLYHHFVIKIHFLECFLLYTLHSWYLIWGLWGEFNKTATVKVLNIQFTCSILHEHKLFPPFLLLLPQRDFSLKTEGKCHIASSGINKQWYFGSSGFQKKKKKDNDWVLVGRNMRNRSCTSLLASSTGGQTEEAGRTTIPPTSRTKTTTTES